MFTQQNKNKIKMQLPTSATFKNSSEPQPALCLEAMESYVNVLDFF